MKSLMIITALLASPAFPAEEIVQTCTTIQGVSISAIKNMTAGMSESQLRGTIPPLGSIKADTTLQQAELLTSMHEILDEIYAFPSLDPPVYSIYRMERCFRRMTGQEIPQDFSEVAPKLEACAANGEDRVECAMQAAGTVLRDKSASSR